MKKKLITALKYLWITAVIVFIALYFFTHFEAIVKIVHLIPLFNLLIAFVALFTAKILLSYTSYVSVEYLSSDIPFSKMFSIYNITQLAKYIPGSIWQFVGKAGAYAKEGLSTSMIKKSILIELLWVLSSAFIMGSLLTLTGDILKVPFIIVQMKDYFIYYLVAAVVFLAISGMYYKKVIIFISLLLEHPSLNIKMIFILTFVWIFLGLSFFITLTPFTEGENISLFVDVIGLYALAYAIGFMVPFAPAGIGIREVILVAGISTFISTEVAIVVASLNRVVYIILEVVIVIVLLQLKLYNYRTKEIT